jgi:hypothetical protein
MPRNRAGFLQRVRQLGDRQRAGVGRQHGVRPDRPLRPGKHVELDIGAFRHGLDQELDAGREGRHVGVHRQPGSGDGRIVSQRAPLGRPGQAVGDPAVGRGGGALIAFHDGHPGALGREDLCDPGSHPAAADDGDRRRNTGYRHDFLH